MSTESISKIVTITKMIAERTHDAEILILLKLIIKELQNETKQNNNKSI